METQYKKLILRGKAIVFIDWANVYGWEKTLKRSINPKKLYDYLKTYAEVIDIRFYFGEDDHPKSKKFLSDTAKTGYKNITKAVKNILIAEIKEKKKIFRAPKKKGIKKLQKRRKNIFEPKKKGKKNFFPGFFNIFKPGFGCV